MLLTLGFGVLDKSDIFEQIGLREHRAGDRNLVVECQLADHVWRRILDRREPIRERLARRKFDIRNEVVEDAVEHGDMVSGEMSAPKDE